jgi:hypothetical protein
MNKNKLIKILIFVGIVLLVIALVKGCNNNKKKESQIIDLQGRIDRYMQDSIESAENLSLNRDTLEGISTQLIFANANYEKVVYENTELGKRNMALLAKHKVVTPSLDTSITTVPNEYINDCESCFTSLNQSQELSVRFRAEADNKEQLLLSKINVQNNRVNYLEKINAQCNKNYKSLLDSSTNKKQELRRTLFFSLGAMAIKQNLPNAIGAGLLYEDKRRRIFGASYYIGAYGSVYQAQVAFPLSLRTK